MACWSFIRLPFLGQAFVEITRSWWSGAWRDEETGCRVLKLPMQEKNGFLPDLESMDDDTWRNVALFWVNYPNNPTGAVVPEGFFDLVVSFARENELLVVHDNAYSETTFDGYVAPSFLATPGAKEVGVEVFSLSKGFNMTGWRCAAMPTRSAPTGG